MSERIVAWALRGFGLLMGTLALVLLFEDNLGAFLGLSVFALFSGGFGCLFPILVDNSPNASPKKKRLPLTAVVFAFFGVMTTLGGTRQVRQVRNGTAGYGLGICLLGLFLVGTTLLVSRAARRRKVQPVAPAASEKVVAPQPVLPSEPWAEREDWRSGRIQERYPADPASSLIFAVIWNVFSWAFATPVLWTTIQEKRIDPILLAVFVFPAFGAALVVKIRRERLRRRRFGESFFHCQHVPTWLGNELVGTVQTEFRTKSANWEVFSIRLACLRSVRSKNGNASDTVSLWEHEERVTAQVGSGPVEIPICIATPPELPTDDVPAWQLTVSCRLPTIDYRAAFDVPIFPPNTEYAVGDGTVVTCS